MTGIFGSTRLRGVSGRLGLRAADPSWSGLALRRE
jgi:hypothetical protein